MSEAIETSKSPSLPWGMLCLAIFFDLIGLIPLLNLLTEIIAGLIIGMWQRSYSPKTDPILSFVIAKIIDIACFGLFPSNIGVVIFAYAKKKAASKNKPTANNLKAMSDADLSEEVKRAAGIKTLAARQANS